MCLAQYKRNQSISVGISVKMHRLKYYGCFILCFCFGIYVEADDVDSTNTTTEAEFEFLLQRIERLENRNEQLENRNNRMERNIEKIQRELDIKEKKIAEQISELERQNDLLRKINEKSYQSFSDKSKEFRIESNEMNGNFNRSESLESKAHFLEPERSENRKKSGQNQRKPHGLKINMGSRQRRATVETKVAFYATVSPHDMYHLGQNQNIVFDTAVTNIGDAYHTRHGIFTAPVDGTYVFCATVNGVHWTDDQTVYAHFDVNGKTVAKFLTHPLDQSTQMIVVQLQAGDDVSIKNDRADEHVLGDTYTSFAGFLLYQNFGSSVDIVGK